MSTSEASIACRCLAFLVQARMDSASYFSARALFNCVFVAHLRLGRGVLWGRRQARLERKIPRRRGFVRPRPFLSHALDLPPPPLAGVFGLRLPRALLAHQ